MPHNIKSRCIETTEFIDQFPVIGLKIYQVACQPIRVDPNLNSVYSDLNMRTVLLSEPLVPILSGGN